MTTLLPLEDLSTRHPGLTKSVGDTYAEAAAVCMSRHHSAPIDVAAIFHGTAVDCVANWTAPDARTLRAWANEIDATEAGAYGVSLAAVEAIEGLVAIRRAETLTGADYYIAPIGSDPDDLENCLRLEVSGVSVGGKSVVEARLRQKLEQTKKGLSNLPALASVIGFKERLIAIAKMGDPK
jgi:hypothetical protein